MGKKTIITNYRSQLIKTLESLSFDVINGVIEVLDEGRGQITSTIYPLNQFIWVIVQEKYLLHTNNSQSVTYLLKVKI